VSSNFWGLANAFGKVKVQLRTTSAAIIDEIEQGKLDIGYNVLGSYALAQQAAGRRIGVVIPEDYVLVLARAALIARHTANPDLARAFLDWLLSPAGQEVAASHAGLGAIVGGTPGQWGVRNVPGSSQGIVQPIVFGPALLVGLDQQRQGRFIQNWMRLMTGAPSSTMTGR
jgi:two-component system sensor histidine kinase TctE